MTLFFCLVYFSQKRPSIRSKLGTYSKGKNLEMVYLVALLNIEYLPKEEKTYVYWLCSG